MKNKPVFSHLWKIITEVIRKVFNTILVMFLSFFLLIDNSVTAKTLGDINIRLTGTIVALSCNIDVSDKTKIVDLGSWPVRQLKKIGDKSKPVLFTINLSGCPAGNLSPVFIGKGDVNDASLLALSDDSTAQNVAIEILDEEYKKIPLGESGPPISIDENGNAKLFFYANYYITANSPVAGSANSDASFIINYE